ncbi:MAG TPA: cytochrome c peroxidase [Saprospiraceae bacterium]|nr:cytochrome c peroxidase [Saprospiraceae bacterium]HMQ82355.1 cytochrome c peroxidase [Saprospiraceae bacterium]
MAKKHFPRYTLLALVFTVLYCTKDSAPPAEDQPYELILPPGFPVPLVPEDNALTVGRVALGKRLFYDPILSRDSSISCATCHKADLAFADSLPITPGVEGRLGFRNAPSLANLAWVSQFNKDGGVAKLDLQPVVPIEDENEMDLSLLKVVDRLNADASYRADFQLAYGDAASAFYLTRALGAFMRTLVSGGAPYDRYKNGQTDALDAEQLAGLALFETHCSNCHSGFNLTDNSFQNNGLYDNYQDQGRKRVTSLPEDEGKFRVPSLRNIALTAPYMHDGSLPDLSAVLDHYTSGGSQHPNKSDLIQPFTLSEQERQRLIRFLESLTDRTFVENPAHRME